MNNPATPALAQATSPDLAAPLRALLACLRGVIAAFCARHPILARFAAPLRRDLEAFERLVRAFDRLIATLAAAPHPSGIPASGIPASDIPPSRNIPAPAGPATSRAPRIRTNTPRPLLRPAGVNRPHRSNHIKPAPGAPQSPLAPPRRRAPAHSRQFRNPALPFTFSHALIVTIS